ncbi:MAG: ATP-binding cassette domain-containing protein [Planctomycetales bacterium]|nr:ATP-binding cassette domain-containing protein [Planctomycetales bacterium]NIM09085.1 ATP-binding cassette domain-containing protein [Planctomycetales bacterium]NIN08543.1 ATP-binding cassette domain-containing protein [Planctomycetales bacterium]NIN77677.1 ATP-binding cassette domain-containing protein [Planctomycetales bacterium]NIO34843.1 ATP-binding cassette domain-containing protein [Planctomycetales bacterium]
MADKLLEVTELGVVFKTDDGLVRAVDKVSLDIRSGETVGIVGESGSGKTVLNLALLGLLPVPPGRITSGRAVYRGADLLAMRPRELSKIRGNRIAMIFQDPMTSLNPFLTVADQLCEVTCVHQRHSRPQALRHAIEMLEKVGIPSAAKRIFDYPHQFSGGMRQRVMIAMALSCQPDLLIADEPTTALDVTIQAQILDLLKQLQREEGTAIILITHDMGVVANICHRVNVMYAGRFVEEAPVDDLFSDPRHPYTQGLLESVPRVTQQPGDKLVPIAGQPPDLIHVPPGCAFQPRCPYRIERCDRQQPPLAGGDEHRFACFVDIQTAPRQEEEVV